MNRRDFLAAALALPGPAALLSAGEAPATAARLTRDGLRDPDGTLLPAPSEPDIYSALGLQTIPAEIRTGEEELVAAARGTLPALVARTDIRGDLHMHTTATDGTATLNNCTFSGNNSGGGVFNRGTATLNNCTFSRNGMTNDGTAMLINCTFSGNTAYGGDGAGVANDGMIGIENEGTYTHEVPTQSLWDSLVDLCAFICQQYRMAPISTAIPQGRANGCL